MTYIAIETGSPVLAVIYFSLLVLTISYLLIQLIVGVVYSSYLNTQSEDDAEQAALQATVDDKNVEADAEEQNFLGSENAEEASSDSANSNISPARKYRSNKKPKDSVEVKAQRSGLRRWVESPCFSTFFMTVRVGHNIEGVMCKIVSC